MSASHAATASTVPAGQPRLLNPGTCLMWGGVLAAATLAGAFLGDPGRVAMSWLIAVMFWLAISIGSLLLVVLHHMFDSGWSTVIRRPLEHWLATFPVLAALFAPLVIISLFIEPSILWKWLDISLVADDILWRKKSGFLNPTTFVVANVVFFGLFIWISAWLRKHSFAQDEDGLAEHTISNRKMSAFGIPAVGLSLTFGAFYWIMSLEHHWFSTMYGVWFFSAAMRAGLAFITILCIYLATRGVLQGIFRPAHMLSLGDLMLAFTVFWAYITFSQYFLIWNANIPEETFWYNLRELNLSTGERNSWWWIGLALLFGHFFLPFFYFLGHDNKLKNGRMIFICVCILATHLLDLYFNILPAMKAPSGDAIPFSITLWDITAIAGVGALCLWAFFRSFARTRCIPIRDPRIVESLQFHE
ncbi:MAG: hypothetical protein ACREIA_02575 [Opitutaceae bacterium]